MNRNKDISDGGWLKGFVSGAFVTAVAFLILFQFLEFDLNENALNITIAMLTICGTLLAAGIALKGIFHQVQQFADAEYHRKTAALMAASAVLPLALSEICNIAIVNIQKSVDHKTLVRNKIATGSEIISQETTNTLKSCIEFSDNQSQARLSQLIYTYQVLQARDRDSIGSPMKDNCAKPDLDQLNQIDRAISWAVLYALSEQAFEFARGQAESIPIEPVNERVFSAFFVAGILIENYPDLKKAMDNRSQKNTFELKF